MINDEWILAPLQANETLLEYGSRAFSEAERLQLRSFLRACNHHTGETDLENGPAAAYIAWFAMAGTAAQKIDVTSKQMEAQLEKLNAALPHLRAKIVKEAADGCTETVNLIRKSILNEANLAFRQELHAESVWMTENFTTGLTKIENLLIDLENGAANAAISIQTSAEVSSRFQDERIKRNADSCISWLEESHKKSLDALSSNAKTIASNLKVSLNEYKNEIIQTAEKSAAAEKIKWMALGGFMQLLAMGIGYLLKF